MKKLIFMTLTICLILAMALPAAAVTPSLNTPTITVPNISDSVQKNLEEQYDFSYNVDSWLDEHPITVDTTEPTETPIEDPTEANTDDSYIPNWLNCLQKWFR